MKYIIRILTIIMVSLPFFVYSAGGLVPCDGPDCDFGSLIKLGNNIIRFCIITGTSVFSIMFMYAGFLYLTAVGDTGKISKAHGLFWNAIIGFVIMLSAWLFIDFILKMLIKKNIGDYKLI